MNGKQPSRALCNGCGVGGTLLTEREIEQGDHTYAEHSPVCNHDPDNCSRTCPIEVRCGPIVRVDASAPSKQVL